MASQVLGRGLKPSCSRRNDYFNVEDIVEIVSKSIMNNNKDCRVGQLTSQSQAVYEDE